MDPVSKPGPLGPTGILRQHCDGVYHPVVEARTIHSLGEGWALDVDHHDRVGDHTAHGSGTDHAGPHVPHATGAILGNGPTGLYLQRRICCGSYSTIVIQLNFDLLLPGVNL